MFSDKKLSRNYSNKHVTRIQEILVTNIFVTRIAKNGDTKLNIRALNFLAFQGEFDISVVYLSCIFSCLSKKMLWTLKY